MDDLIGGSPLHLHIGYCYVHSGVPDGTLELEKLPLAIAEGMGIEVGQWQLLGAIIKMWTVYKVYPVGKCTAIKFSRIHEYFMLG